jgi:hypothetical protein
LRLCKQWQIGRFVNEVAKDLQKAIRMEAADDNGVCVCVTCGKRDHYKEMDAGHFIPGRRPAYVFVEENIHPQCKHCNAKLGGRLDVYAAFILKTYGQSVLDSLQALRHGQHKYTREQLADMRDGYKARIKVQEKRLCGR